MAETRKTVTIVFADVTGSTALGEQTDPEAMRRIMERYFEEMRSVLEKHGGTVEKFIGDAVMAVFGIPVVREDDALRAVRAAAEMRERLAALNEEFERERGITIAVRTGVNTGEVVAGDPSQGQAFATGDAVNVAARLEQAATSGEILIGSLTRRLAGEAIEAEPVEPLAVKGKTAPIEAWRLVDVRRGTPAFTRRLDAPFVGRQEELAALRAVFERARERGRAELVTVTAPAGLGKSRLARELVAAVGGEARVVVGRCLPYGEAITYWPLGDIVRQVAGERIEEGLAQVLAREEDAKAVSAHLAAAVGVGETPSRSEEIAWATRRLLEALARDRPLVVVADDVHWAEETLLDLIEYVVGFAAAPVLLLCLARPDLFETRPSWGVPRPNATTVVLEPLGHELSDTLLAALLGGADLAESLRRQIVDRAEGNPLFVEQMLAHVRESGNGEVAVPPTIDALLMARIDSLTASERAVVECGAVEGRLFHRGAVAALLREADGRGVTADLMALVRKELIRPDEAEFAGDDGFRFVHVLVRDAAYAAIPKEARAELHERYAHWLEQRAAARLPEVAEILGYHFEQSFRCREALGGVDAAARRLGRLAADHLGRAGRRAAVRGDAAAARNLLERALALLPADDPARPKLLPDLVDICLDGGASEPARRALDEARGWAVGEPERALVDVLEARLRISFDPEGAGEQGLDAATRAIPLLEATGDDRGLAEAWELIEEVHWQRGELSLVVAAAEKALRYAERIGDVRAVADHRSKIGAALYFGLATSVGESLTWAEEELQWAREAGVRWHEGMLLVALGAIRAVAKLPQAARTVADGQAILEDLGVKVIAAAIVANWAHLLSDDPADWERELRRSYDVLKEAGERGFLSTITASLADSVYRQGRLDEAFELTRESEEAGASDDVSTQVTLRGVRAKILARRGDAAEAERLARDAVAQAEATEYFWLRTRSLTDLAEVLRLAGRETDAADVLEAALELYERKGDLLDGERTRARLAELQSAGSPSQ